MAFVRNGVILKLSKLAHYLSNCKKWVVDVDLKSYFDTILHEKLEALIRKRVGDKYVLALIRQWLKAGIMEEGKVRRPTDGTPQGGVLSPLLSNIYLNEIDKLWNENSSVEIVRYADDMVLFCRTEKQAHYVLNKLRGQLEELGLILNEEKTKIVHVRESFDFLGYTIKEAYSHNRGKLVRIKFPRPKSEKNMRQKIKDAIKSMLLGTEFVEVIAMLNRKLSGWANSYFYEKGLYYVPNLLSK